MLRSGIEEVRAILEEVASDETGALQPDLDGFSGTKIVQLLTRLAQRNTASDACYLEIGVYRGLTLLSVAAAARNKLVFGVDDFSAFNVGQQNQHIVELERARRGLHNATVLQLDFEQALRDLEHYLGSRRIDCYFVDGPHDYRSQLLCLLLAKSHLHDAAVIVIDDCNYLHVRQATSDFLLSEPSFKLLFEAYTCCHPKNMDSAALAQARSGWWNGVHVLVRDDEDVLAPCLPPTTLDRQHYFAEHDIHAARYPAAASVGTSVASFAHSLLTLRPLAAVRNLRRSSALCLTLARRGASQNFNTATTYDALNTHSDGLPTRLASWRR